MQKSWARNVQTERKRDLIRVPWMAVPLLWGKPEASFHTYSAEGNQKPDHAKMFCCERGKRRKVSKGGKIKKASKLLWKPKH